MAISYPVNPDARWIIWDKELNELDERTRGTAWPNPDGSPLDPELDEYIVMLKITADPIPDYNPTLYTLGPVEEDVDLDGNELRQHRELAEKPLASVKQSLTSLAVAERNRRVDAVIGAGDRGRLNLLMQASIVNRHIADGTATDGQIALADTLEGIANLIGATDDALAAITATIDDASSIQDMEFIDIYDPEAWP